MSLSNTIGQVAAINPVVGVAVQSQSTTAALLAGISSLGSSDSATDTLLQMIAAQPQAINNMLAQLEPNLGQNVDTTA